MTDFCAEVRRVETCQTNLKKKNTQWYSTPFVRFQHTKQLLSSSLTILLDQLSSPHHVHKTEIRLQYMKTHY